jgi:endonuclease/exonuclease/phosphatase family metal-dependent hydrolase
MAESNTDHSERAAEEEEEGCPLEAPPGFRSRYDDLGRPAFETDASTAIAGADPNSTPCTSASAPAPCIRLQAEPDECLLGMTTAADVEEKIRRVREEMGRHGHNSDLYPRRWVPGPSAAAAAPVARDAPGAHRARSFSVVQFNALAEGLSSGASVPLPFGRTKEHNGDDRAAFGGFTAVPLPEVCLDFDKYRKWRILEVVAGRCYRYKDGTDDSRATAKADACSTGRPFDIIGMEEVDRFGGFFAPALALCGYKGIFHAKPRAPGVRLGWYSDGCSLFWRTDTFDLVDKARHRFSAGTQVYLLATLRHKLSGKLVLVAVTHLKASKSDENAMIRELQSAELLRAIEEKAKAMSDAEGCGNTPGIHACVPTIVLGDFNAERDEVAVKDLVGGVEIVEKKPSSFVSAYPSHLQFTTWKTRGTTAVKRVIDYIFYSRDCPSFKCTEILDLPAEKDMEEHGLPGFRSPSDHLALAARFEI